MNPVVEGVLRSAGWYPERVADCDSILSRFREQGFEYTPLALKIMREFGGLTVSPHVDSESVYLHSTIVFDPTVACDGQRVEVQYWENRLSCTLSPIASLDGPIALLVGSDECIYGIWGNIAWKYGESFVDALENTLIVATRHPVLLGD